VLRLETLITNEYGEFKLAIGSAVNIRRHSGRIYTLTFALSGLHPHGQPNPVRDPAALS